MRLTVILPTAHSTLMIAFLLTFVGLAHALRRLARTPEFRVLLTMVAAVLTGGTIFYHQVEGWSWLDSLYFSVITLATVGYGDFAPKTDPGKIFTMVYIVLGISLLAAFVKVLGDDILRHRQSLAARPTDSTPKSDTPTAD